MTTSGAGDSSQRVIAWCARCREQPPGQPDQWLVGTRYRCSRATLDDFHVAAIVPPNIMRWLNGAARLVRYFRSDYHPRNFNSIGAQAELYGVLLFGAMFMALWLASKGSLWAWGGSLVAMAIILDLLAYNVMVVFITQHPQLPIRSVFFGIGGFILLALGFSVFYAGIVPDSFNQRLDVWSAIYFSFVTIATVGYGDIAPLACATGARFLVIAEVLTGLFYIVVLLATMVGWVNAPVQLKTEQEIGLRASPDATQLQQPSARPVESAPC